MAGRKKILVKVTNNGTLKRVHFCYIDGDLKSVYKRITGQTSSTIIDRISVWAWTEFGLAYPKLTPEGITAYKEKLRKCIVCKYRKQKVPPEIIYRNPINGWIAAKMKKEIENE